MTLARELADTAGRPQVDKNIVINGGMDVFQRSTSVASVTTSGYRAADRFRHTISSMGTWTFSRSTDVPSAQGFSYSLKLDCTTADASPAASDFHSLQHRIEGQNLQHLLKGTSSAKALTLSFWVKSNKTGTYIVSLFDNDNSRNISKSYTIDTASTWEKKEITFAGDTTGTLDNDNANSLQLEFFFGAGTDYSSGTLQTSWGAYSQADRAVGQVNLADSTSNELYITGIQLEIGEATTDFQFEPYQTTINKCYRYFEKVDCRLLVVMRDSGSGTGTGYNSLYFKQSKRDTPTTTITTGLVNFNRPDFARITTNVSVPAGGVDQFPNADHHIKADAEL
jgi:hypothetical protein